MTAIARTEPARQYQPEPSAIVWGCGHSSAVFLVVDVLEAAEQLAAYTQIDCLSCAKAARAQVRGICWIDR